MAIKVGDHAPDFTLVSDDKSSITLSSYCNESNVVLLFFPLAFTGVCTKEWQVRKICCTGFGDFCRFSFYTK